MFFFNPSTRSSVWEKPEDLKNRPDVDKLIANVPDESPQQGNSIYISSILKVFLMTFLSIHAADKKEEIKEVVKLDKKKKSEIGTDEPPPKKSKSSEEGKVVSFLFSETI